MSPHKIGTPPDSADTMHYQTSSTSASSRRPLVPGIYVPTPCFFLPNEEVDTDTIASHAVRLAHAGLAGITTQGSNGEAVHLTHEERNLVTRTTRTALDNAGFPNMPIIVGCGAQSTRESIVLAKEAAESGGDYLLVLPPSYFKASYSRQSLLAHFNAIADASPLPLLIYNYPGAAAGIDLDSDFVIELSKHKNIIGAKLTCGNVGKLGRVASATADTDFLVLAGSADFLLPSLAASGHGALAGLANIVPKACVAAFQAFHDGKWERAKEIQSILARADWIVQQGGVVGTKAALESFLGYGGYARSPMPRWNKEECAKNKAGFEEAIALENSL